MKLTPHQLAAMIHGVTSHINRPDGSEVPIWEDLPASSSDHAAGAVVRLIFENPNPITPEGCHDLWMRLQVGAGWQWGETYCLDSKLHPCLVPFRDLPVSEQLKDHVWADLVTLFAPYVSLP